MAVLSFLTYLRGIYKLNLESSSRVHYAIIQSIYDCFIMAKDDLNLSRLEMCLKTATGFWLDTWGDYFSVYRDSGELDSEYAQRIIDEVIKPKCTIPSIKDNIVDHLNKKHGTNYTREDVQIIEPWREVAKYSHKGSLSNDARFCSGDYYTHAVLDIRIQEDVTKELIDLIKGIKAAGVKIIWSMLNSYDIVSGFNTADDAWAAYKRHVQMNTDRRQYSGLTLSNSSPNPRLSGRRETWYMVTSTYQWYAVVNSKKTDESIIITKKDLIGLIDYYDKIVVNGEETIEVLTKITDELIESLGLLDKFLTLSYKGKLSTSSGVMFQYVAQHDDWSQLIKAVDEFKAKYTDYYNSVQPPILNGERAMWLVQRNENWLWNTPTMTHQDFFELWEPFGEYEEHTINSIVEFEDAYYKGYITFGDQYQPPIVIGKPFYWTPFISKNWLYDSPAFTNDDLEQLYLRQFYPMGTVEKENPNLEDILLLEEKYLRYGHSVQGEEQPEIEVKSEPYTP